jgi:hypothetical protein
MCKAMKVYTTKNLSKTMAICVLGIGGAKALKACFDVVLNVLHPFAT